MSEQPILQLIRDLQAKQVDPKSLSSDMRRQVVSHLKCEGYSHSEIAVLLGLCGRTIERDVQALRVAQALHPDPDWVPQRIGQLVARSEQSIQRLERLRRNKTLSAQEICEIEAAIMQIELQTVRALQSLGYLPMASIGIRTIPSDIDNDFFIAEARRLNAIAPEHPEVVKLKTLLSPSSDAAASDAPPAPEVPHE